MYHVTDVGNYVKAKELLVTKITSFLHISCDTKFKLKVMTNMKTVIV